MCDSHITFYCCNTLMCNTYKEKLFRGKMIQSITNFHPLPKRSRCFASKLQTQGLCRLSLLVRSYSSFWGSITWPKNCFKTRGWKSLFFLEKVVNGHFIQDPFCKQRLWSFFLVWPQQTLIGLTAEPWVVFDLQLMLLCLPSHPWCCRW